MLRWRGAGRSGGRGAAALVLLALGGAGCLGDLVPVPSGPAPQSGTAPPPSDDGGSGDGGASLFQTMIWPDVARLNCPACHNGGPPMRLIASPASSGDWMMNYAQFSARAGTGPQSLVLTKNLVGSGVTHGGPKPFASTSDATYTNWLNWIMAGAPP